MTSVFFLALMIHKEIIAETRDERWQRLGRALNVILLPLALAFLFIMVVELMKYF